MAERIKMLFVVNTPGAQGTLHYTGVLIPDSEGKGYAHSGPTTYLKITEARD